MAQVILKLLSFVLSMLIIRYLGPDEYGQYAAVLAFGGVFVFLADLGLGTYTVRAVARLRDQVDGQVKIEQLLGDVFGLRLILAVVTAGIIIGAALLSQRPPQMILGIALGTIGLVMYAVQGTAEAALAGYERIDIPASAKLVHQIAFLLLAAVALYSGSGYLSLIGANLLGILLMTSICWRGLRRIGVQMRRVALVQWPVLLRASLPFGIIGLTLGLSYKFDSVLLNIYFGDRATGYYNAAYNLVFSAVMLSNVLNTALYPSLARQSMLAADRLPVIYERAMRYLLMTSLPIAVGVWVLSGQLILFLFDADYAPTIPALRWLAWVIPLMFMTEFLGYVILVDGHERRVARSVILSTLTNVGLNLVFVPRYGYLAAAVMTVVTETVLLSQYVFLLKPLMQRIDWSVVLLRPLLAACLMGSVVYVLQGLPLFANVITGAIVYGILLLAFKVVGKDELRFMHNLYSRSLRGAEHPL